MLFPKKSLGQNFLKDKNILNKIVKLINNIENVNIIEIGPGTGNLTEIILKKNPAKLILIEKDKYLYEELLNKYKNNQKIELHNFDALKFDFKKINKPKTIIGNLPYNISIKLIINWLKDLKNINEIIVMIQKEVAQKMSLKKNIKMNRLNVLTTLTSNFNIEFDVSKNVFFPKPKITSSVVKITPKSNNNYNFKKIENFTRMLFRNKRKKLKNVIPEVKLIYLKKHYNFNLIDLLNYRAEDLSLEKIIFLFEIFYRDDFFINIK